MVTNITSLTGNGLKDWLIQRGTAVYLTGYLLFLCIFYYMHVPLTYTVWASLFACPWMKIATVLAFFALLLHSWIGIWTVTTDYIKCTAIRISTQVLVRVWLLGQFLWGILIVWGK